MSETIFSTNKEIENFFKCIKCDPDDFINRCAKWGNTILTDKIDYEYVSVDLGKSVFIATVNVSSGTDRNAITIEKTENGFIIQPYKDEVEDDESITVSANSFIGRRCAIIMTIAQCLCCDDQLINDIENKKKEVCYL